MDEGVDDRSVPLSPQPWQYSDRLFEALTAAAQIHAAQVRKDTAHPVSEPPDRDLRHRLRIRRERGRGHRGTLSASSSPPGPSRRLGRYDSCYR